MPLFLVARNDLTVNKYMILGVLFSSWESVREENSLNSFVEQSPTTNKPYNINTELFPYQTIH